MKIIQAKDMIEKPQVPIPKKSKTHLPSGYVFNIETGETYSIVPQEAKANELPIYARSSNIVKNNSYRDAVIIDMRRKLKKVKENIGNCDYNTLTNLCEVSSLVNIHSKYLYFDPSFDLLDRDVMRAREEFIEKCKLSKKIINK